MPTITDDYSVDATGWTEIATGTDVAPVNIVFEVDRKDSILVRFADVAPVAGDETKFHNITRQKLTAWYQIKSKVYARGRAGAVTFTATITT
ncbi:MAG: hypothetical protein AAGL24_10120 [Pseudomonadota bacterium]